MIPKKITRLTVTLCCFVFLLCYEIQAQSFYYVVIGGFRIENNAKKFTGYARTKYYDARYELNRQHQLFYVYVQRTTDREAAIKQTVHLQKNSEFSDAWVFTGLLGDAPATAVVPDVPFIEEPDTTSLAEELLAAAEKDTSLVLVEAKPDEELNIELGELRVGRIFKFLLQTTDGKILPGSVHHVDLSRGRDIASFPTGRNITILPPTRANNPMTVVCGIFGYKEVLKQIDYLNPEATEGANREGNAWVITYPLERVTKGDVSVMYHVSFYLDAVVMLPQSKAELDELVNMMQNNPNYKIKIHGHCNGTHNRRIIALGKNKNYFDVQRGSEEIEGSAKTLTRLRAQAVQMYLVDHGIDKSRTEIYGWGGSNMLVDEHSPSAKLNDRIEIEILAH